MSHVLSLAPLTGRHLAPRSTAQPYNESTFEPLECEGAYRPAFEDELDVVSIRFCPTANWRVRLHLFNT